MLPRFLELFGNRRPERLQTRRRSRFRPSVELLADRLLPAVTSTTFVGGLLQINGDNNQDFVVLSQSSSGEILLNGSAMSQFATRPTITNTLNIRIFGAGGENILILDLPGYTGRDELTGGPVGDLLVGGNGPSVLFGDRGTDWLRGGLGDDTINGGGEADTVYEIGGGNLTLTNTRLTGRGTDTLISIERADLNGSDGNDTFDARTFSGFVDLDGGLGHDELYAGTGGSSLRGGGDGDFLFGGWGNDWLGGDGGDDVLYGYGGDDTLMGGADNDYLWGGFGNDSIDGGNNVDTVYETSGMRRIVITNTTLTHRERVTLLPRSSEVNFVDSLFGIEEAHLVGTNNHDSIDASAVTFRTRIDGLGSQDLLIGGTVKDIIHGGAGNDIIVGNGGDDELWGEDGRDLLIGGAGADQLRGGPEQDILIGGYTSYDSRISSLFAIRDEWSRVNSYAISGGWADYVQRVTHVSYFGVSSGNVRLRATAIQGLAQTVFDDGATDTLRGGAEYDLFFANVWDLLPDRRDPSVFTDSEFLNPW